MRYVVVEFRPDGDPRHRALPEVHFDEDEAYEAAEQAEATAPGVSYTVYELRSTVI